MLRATEGAKGLKPYISPPVTWHAASLHFTEEVECFANLFVGGRLVELQLTDVGEQCEVDGAGGVLLVVRHQTEQRGIVVAGDGRSSIMFAHELHRLAQTVGGEVAFHGREIQLADKAVGNSIAVE